MTTSLYIHIPFCVRKCCYCDFFSIPYGPSVAQGYVEALCREFAMRRGEAVQFRTVYIGGGTPTVLPDGLISTVLETVCRDGGLTHDAEVTVEANPGSLTREKARGLVRAGVNRMSIGIQSLRDRDLRILGRSHTAAEAREAVRIARSAGIANLSVDLIYAVPGQRPEEWFETLEEALDLGPDHVSAYELTVEEHTPLRESLESGQLALPCEDAVIEMYDGTAGLLGRRGFRQYEISNYSIPGYECRHNLNYWERGRYLGIGAGAHSFIGDVRSANVRDVGAYIREISDGRLAVNQTLTVDDDEALREVVFLGLRKTDGIDTVFLPAGPFGLVKKAVEELVSHGLAELRQNRLRLTRKGFVLSNEAIARLLSAL